MRTAWPSPQQFNHCIIAVKVSDETHIATVVQHPRFGRLLIFDPTGGRHAGRRSAGLPAGQSGPDRCQGSRPARADAGNAGRTMNHLERTVEAQLGADGSMTGVIEERARGQVAARFRTEFRRLSRSDYNTMVEHWLTNGAPGSKISKVEPVDDASRWQV